MQWTGLMALACALTCAAPLRADETDRFGLLGAALVLWGAAQQEERADYGIAALEVITRLSPKGAAPWLDEALVETRLMALGDPDVLGRAAALSLGPEDDGLRLLITAGGRASVTLPPGSRLDRVQSPPGTRIASVTDAQANTCPDGDGPVLRCGAAGLTGEISFEGRPAVFAIEVLPDAEDSGK